MSQTEAIRALIEPVLRDEGLELFDCEHKAGLLRVLVQGGDGVDIARLGRLSQRLSLLLDERDLIAERYTLEVSSPGLERVLRTPEHFKGAVGTVITVRTTGETTGDGEAERRERGVLSAADDTGIVINDRRITYDHIDRARTVFEWGGQPKPGQPKLNNKKKAAS